MPRLTRFRRDHPGVAIHAGHGYWQALIPEPSGEIVITRYRLTELLDKLDTLTGPPAPSSPGRARRPCPARPEGDRETGHEARR